MNSNPIQHTPHKNYTRFFISISLITVLLILYWPVHGFDFINFDDGFYVKDNLHVQKGLTIENLIWAFKVTTQDNQAYWHPLTWLSHMLDFQVFGLHAGCHHFVNLIFHILNSLLLFFILDRMTGSIWKSAFVSALFAFHPINVDSVAWISERKNVLSSFFWMLTILSYLYYSKKPVITRYFITLLIFIIGLLAKPMLVTLPFVLLLLDFWPLNRIEIPDRDHLFKNLKTKKVLWVIAEKVPFLIFSMIAIGLATISLKHNDQLVSSEFVPLVQRLSNGLISYIKYIYKLLYPQKFAIFYPFPESLPLWQVIGSILLLAIISVYVLRYLQKLKFLPVGWFWYLGTLFPVIGLIQGGRWPEMADRWAYIPFIGLFIIISWGGSALIGFFFKGLKTIISLIAATAILFILIILSSMQLTHWENSISLFEHAIAVTSRNPVAYFNLGAALASIGKTDEAIKNYKISLDIKGNAEVYVNMGNALAKKGLFDEAVKNYLEALKINPNYVNAHINLGNTYSEARLFEKAVYHYNEALKQSPQDVVLLSNMGKTYFQADQPKKAEGYFTKILQLDPNNWSAYNSLGTIFAKQKKFTEAVECFQKAVSINPGFVDAIYNLAIIYAAQNKFDPAIDEFKKLIGHYDTAKIYYNIACLYARQKNTDEAISWLKKAVESGYDNWHQIQTDADLTSIRDSSYFIELMTKNH